MGIVKSMKRILSMGGAFGKISSFCIPSGILLDFTPIVKAQETEGNDDWLHVEGNQIVDMNGKPVWLTGANWFGFNTGTNVFDGVWSCNMREALETMADRGINFLRIPVSTEILTKWKKGSPPMPGSLNDYVNPELDGLNSLELFDFALNVCKEVGIKIMVDVHSPQSQAMGHIYPVWYDAAYDTEAWISSLEWMAERYKNDDTILAFDIENEPHGKPTDKLIAKWDNSTDLNNWKYAAETCADRVLAINPNLLIMVEGIEAYPKEGNDYTAVDAWGEESHYYFNWWGGNLRGVKDKPLDLGANQDQLVYSPHDYGPLVYQQPWFKDGFTRESVYNDCWKDNWAFIYEDGIAPLLIGEWGGFMDGGPNEKWMTAMRDYIVDNRIHHTFWCYNANSGDTGGLVTHDFITWDEEKYELLKPALWQHDGKFVSLDHKVPLGANGISVSQVNGEVKPTPTVTKGETPTKTTSPTPTISASNDLVFGDLNGDDAFNSIDFGLIRMLLLGLKAQGEVNGKAADVDGSGQVNALDFAYMRQHLLGMITKFPVEN